MLWEITWNYHRTYGNALGSVDDLFAEACIGFLQAYETYDPSKGEFTTHVYWRANSRLLKHQRSQLRQKRTHDYPEDIPAPVPRWQLFLAELSTDAKIIARLAVDPPQGLQPYLENKRQKAKKILREYLEGRQWTEQRIDNAFHELQEAVS